MTWRRLFLLLAWVLIIPPITPAKDGQYIGHNGHPVSVELGEPLFRWTVFAHFQTGADCGKKQSALRLQSLRLDPADAKAVAYSFAKCLKDNDPLLQPDSQRTW